MTASDLMRPLPDQIVAIEKLRKVRYRLCGDSMGVGKTVTGIGLDFAMREDYPEYAAGPTLIISEKIGLDVWHYHLRAMGVPEAAILVIDPTSRVAFEDALEKLARAQGGRGVQARRYGIPRYYIMHWDVLNRVDLITAKNRSRKPIITWAHVIADEVHLAKNRKALRTKALKAIAAEFKTGLSGTPADDKPWDIWSVLNWLYPKKYSSYWRFFENHVEYEEVTNWKTKTGYRSPTGVKNIPELHRQMEPFYIRRTLLEVAPDMPEKVHVQPPIVVPMEKKQRRAYESMRDKAIALIGEDTNSFTLLAPAIIAVLTRLQQMALATIDIEWGEVVIKEWQPSEIDPFLPPEIREPFDEDQFTEEEVEYDFPKLILSKPSPKLDAVMNLITTHEEEPFVVFTQFRGMADLVEEECQRLKIPVVKITGEVTSKDKRTRLVQEFQDGKARVFVGTIAAAGKTITLTRANIVIFTDLSWNPSKNDQAEDRLWRRTQRNTVRVYTIQSEDSIDQIRAARISQKADMIHALLNPR